MKYMQMHKHILRNKKVQKNTLHQFIFWLAVSSINFLILDFANATPCFIPRRPIRLDVPGLWLVHIDSYSPSNNCNPVGQQWGRFSFRVYCPTKMIREITGGNWQQAKTLKQYQDCPTYECGYDLGSMAYEQACER